MAGGRRDPEADRTFAVRRQFRALHQHVLFDGGAGRGRRFDETDVQHVPPQGDTAASAAVKAGHADATFPADEHAVQQQPALGHVRQVQAPEDGQGTGVDRVAAQLGARKAGAVDQRDPHTRARQHEGRNSPGRTSPRNHDVMHGRARSRYFSNQIPGSCRVPPRLKRHDPHSGGRRRHTAGRAPRD